MVIISPRSFGSDDSNNLSDHSLNYDPIIILEKEHHLTKKLLKTSDLQDDNEIVIATFDKHLLDDNDKNEALSYINSQLEHFSYLSVVNQYNLNELSLDLKQINDYYMESDIYQHISEFNNHNLQLLNFSSTTMGLIAGSSIICLGVFLVTKASFFNFIDLPGGTCLFLMFASIGYYITED